MTAAIALRAEFRANFAERLLSIPCFPELHPDLRQNPAMCSGQPTSTWLGNTTSTGSSNRHCSGGFHECNHSTSRLWEVERADPGLSAILGQ
jgi:hypothetical protein